MAFIAPLIPAITAAFTVVGAGVAFVGASQQAAATQAIGEENARLQAANAQVEANAQRTQAAMLRDQTNANYALQQKQAGQKSANARAMRERAGAQDDINARNLRLKRQEGERIMASQRAKYAAAGAVDSTGSPLSLLAETAGLIERDIGERKYHDDLAQNGLYHEAALERLGGQYALAGATMDRQAGRGEANLREAGASAGLLSGLRTSQITRLAGRTQAQGMRTAAYGNLLTGFAGAFKSS